jgi:amino acid adenylation domain-containing protein
MVGSNQQLQPESNRWFAADRIFAFSDKFPHKPAIISSTRRTTYGQLALRAQQLSLQIQNFVGSDRGIVAICSSDPHELTIAALAAWRLGCAYLPIDPKGPVKRNQRILAEVNPAVILADQTIGEQLAVSGQTVLAPELDFSPLPPASERSGRADLEDADPAYVIYTSGSTGQPKGIRITQANLRHLIRWHGAAFQITSEDRGTQFAPLTFDASVLEIWPMLGCGATLFVPEREVVLNPESLRDFVVANEVTVCFAATPLAERLLELDWPRDSKLRYLLTGGDVLREFPKPDLPFKVVNNYGPTECTVLATSGIVSAEDSKILGFPAIGRPISGTDVFILDGSFVPVPMGVEGQIAIGGDGVAAEYLAAADLTNERFRSGLWPAGPRIYLTGDRGRQLPDGRFEFCGRIDEQVKILGNRVEPGEIAAALRGHAGISDAAVAVVADAPSKQLIAWIIASAELPDSEIRAYLLPLLPSFMIPDSFVRVETLPVSRDGSVNYCALIRDLPRKDDPTSALEALSGEIETAVSAILASIFKGITLGPNDNFFRLGGHSLLAAQIIGRIRKEFRINLELRAIFENPTIAGLSRVIERQILQTLSAGGSTRFAHA